MSKVKVWTKDDSAWVDKGVFTYASSTKSLDLTGPAQVFTFPFKQITDLSNPSTKRMKFKLSNENTEYLLQFQNDQATTAVQNQINDAAADASMDELTSITTKASDEEKDEEEDEESGGDFGKKLRSGRLDEDEEKDDEEGSQNEDEEKDDEEDGSNSEEDDEGTPKKKKLKVNPKSKKRSLDRSDSDTSLTMDAPTPTSTFGTLGTSPSPLQQTPGLGTNYSNLFPAAPISSSAWGTSNSLAFPPLGHITSISPSALAVPQFNWFWKADHAWIAYDAIMNATLSRASYNGEKNVKVDDERFIDLKEMLQRRYDDHNKRRQVKKEAISTTPATVFQPFTFGSTPTPTNNNTKALSPRGEPSLVLEDKEEKEEDDKRRKKEETERKEREKETLARGSEKEQREKRMKEREDERDRLIKDKMKGKLVDSVITIEQGVNMINKAGLPSNSEDFDTRMPEDEFDEDWTYGYKLDLDPKKKQQQQQQQQQQPQQPEQKKAVAVEEKKPDPKKVEERKSTTTSSESKKVTSVEHEKKPDSKKVSATVVEDKKTAPAATEEKAPSSPGGTPAKRRVVTKKKTTK